MRKSLIIAAVLAALTSNAFAADMAIKAPPLAAVASGSGSGWYVGLGTEGAVASSSVQGTNFTGLNGGNFNAAGASLGIDIGYIWNNCLMGTWCQLEADGKWQNVSGSTTGGAINSKWSVSGEFDLGIQPITTIMSALNLNNPFPTFDPSGILSRNIAVSTIPREYLGFIADVLQVGGTFGSATGQTVAFAPGVTGGYRWQTLGGTGLPNGGSLKVYAEILWPTKGATFGNVFATNGSPLTVNASGAMSTMYLAGIHYDFGVPSR